MIYLKGVLAGIGIAVGGGLLAALLIAALWFREASKLPPNVPKRTHGETLTIVYNLSQFTQPWMWVLIIALFVVGFLTSVYLQRTRVL